MPMYRGFNLVDAFADKIALYECGSFKGHFESAEQAQAFVDAKLFDAVRGEG